MSVSYTKENQTIVLLGKILTHISNTLSSLKSSSAISGDFETEKTVWQSLLLTELL